MKKGYCIYCEKKLKKNYNGKSVHRKCWLAQRSFDDRIYDFLFYNKDLPTKCLSIKPDNTIEEDEYDTLINDLEREKKNLIQYDDCEDDNLCYDLGGNLITI